MGLLGSIEETAANAVVPGSGALLHIGRWFGRHWQTILVGIALAGLAVLIWKAPWAYSAGAHSRDAEVAQLKQQYADLQAADAKAQAEAVQRALEVEHARDAVREEQSHEIRGMYETASADAERYLDRLRRAQTGPASGNGSKPNPAAPGEPAAGIDGAGAVSVVDAADVRICTKNTVNAIAWPAFWAKMKALEQ